MSKCPAIVSHPEVCFEESHEAVRTSYGNDDEDGLLKGRGDRVISCLKTNDRVYDAFFFDRVDLDVYLENLIVFPFLGLLY